MAENELIDRIQKDANRSGVTVGGLLLVHSSLSSMGQVSGGPETVVQGLLKALGPDGTLLMPALSYRHVDLDNPVFELAATPSNVGAIPECFRMRPGTRRSIHPTHSVCGIGPMAEGILGEHHLDETPCGAHSPYRKLRDLGGQILFLGCGLKPNTSMHAVEELVQPPYLFGSVVAYRAILPDGREVTGNCRRHGFAGWGQRYDRLGPVLSEGGVNEDKILDATVYLVDCRTMWQEAQKSMRKDPFFFVERR
jgi:aminoglycoside 3-N-acetyltransferase